MIDVLLATCNGGLYLRKQIDSVINQSYKNWRLIVHDDGSTDNTCSIVREYQKHYKNITLIDDAHSYGEACRNFEFLLSQSIADYSAFCDQDDVWHSNKLESLLIKIREIEDGNPANACIVYSDLSLMNEFGCITEESMWKHQGIEPQRCSSSFLLLENHVTGCTLMINKRMREKVIPFPQEAIMHDWWISLMAASIGRITYCDAPLVDYRQHGNNCIGAKKYTFSATAMRIILHPISILRHLTRLHSKIVLQLNALVSITKNEGELNGPFIRLAKDYIAANHLRRSYLMIKHSMLGKGAVRKIGKLIFY